MNKRIIMLMAAALALLSASGQVEQVEFTGIGEQRVIPVTPEKGTELKKVYVIYNTDGVGMTYTASSNEMVTWYSYDYRGGSLHIEPIYNVVHNGKQTTLQQVLPNTGYKIVEGTRPYYCWVVNYADYPLSLNGISWDNSDPCDFLELDVDGVAHKIRYYDVNGRALSLDRELELHYTTLKWDDSGENHEWTDSTVVETFESLDNGIKIDQPLCNTSFTLSGDRFLKEWNLPEKSTESSEVFETQAVKCRATYETDNKKELKIDPPLSAPLHVVFTGHPTDAAVNERWEVATDPEFEEIILRFDYQNKVDYTFNDAGTYYVRYIVANEAGTCEDSYDISPFKVSESDMSLQKEIPNVLCLGIGDIWKVPKCYSIVDFHCWIFNRWGNLVYEYTDPEGYWDGTSHGREVDTGVYYYVITATGIDGTPYPRRGDITVLRYSRGDVPPSSDPGGGN